MSQARRHFSVEQKAQIVRRHLTGKVPVSELSEELGIQPSVIHAWVKLVLDQAEKAFDRTQGRSPRIEHARDRRIEQLQAKLTEKNEVIAELMQEHVKLKKETGEL